MLAKNNATPNQHLIALDMYFPRCEIKFMECFEYVRARIQIAPVLSWCTGFYGAVGFYFKIALKTDRIQMCKQIRKKKMRLMHNVRDIVLLSCKTKND